MKTLQQVEPRIDLQNAPASAVIASDPNYQYLIIQPGSYYLSANLEVTKANGIWINAANVTLDLGGFQISRASGSGGNGIQVYGSGTSVRNGSITGFLYGIRCFNAPKGCTFRELAVSGCTGTGINAEGDGAVLDFCRVFGVSGSNGYGINAGDSAVVPNCTTTGNAGLFNLAAAIRVGNGAVLTNCTATGNQATNIIIAGNGSTLTNCAVSANSGDSGIVAGARCSLTNCAANLNTLVNSGLFASTGSSMANCTAMGNSGSFGILTGSASSLTNCSATENTDASKGISTFDGCSLTNCSAKSNGGIGIHATAGCTLTHCTAENSGSHGFEVGSTCNLANNSATSNQGAGFHVTGGWNRIDSNHTSRNPRDGLVVDDNQNARPNVIFRNTAFYNSGFQYRISGIPGQGTPGDNIVGPLSGDASTSSPWANFQGF